MPTVSSEEARAQANQYNALLAQRIRRWARVRLTVGGALFVAGMAVWMIHRSFLYGLPLLIAAGIGVVLWLDARETLGEVHRRKWQRITPGRRDAQGDESPADHAKAE